MVKRELVEYARKQYQVSLLMDWHAGGTSDSVYRYRPDVHQNNEIIAMFQEAAEGRPVY